MKKRLRNSTQDAFDIIAKLDNRKASKYHKIVKNDTSTPHSQSVFLGNPK